MSATFAICIATYGDLYWQALAQQRAIPSAEQQGADELLIHHDPQGTRHGVRNHLADLASSEYLVYVDSDDHLAPGFIDALRAAAPPRGRFLLNPAVGHASDPDNHACFAPKELRSGNYLIIGTAVPRSLFHEVGGFWNWPGFEDWELWIRCTKAGARVIQVPDAVYLIDSTERSRDRNAHTSETTRWLMEIRRYHWPEIYGRIRPSGRRAVPRTR